MAVEARHMNFFPSDRDLMKTNQGIMNPYNTQMESGLPFYSPMPEPLLPTFYQSSPACDSIPAKTSINKADSGLTYNNITAPRKRPRDSINDFDPYNNNIVSQKNTLSDLSSFVDQDFMFQLHQQQSDIDRLIAEHTEKVRIEIEERRKRQSRVVLAAIQEEVIKKLKEKDEEIQRMGKLNWVLQERVKNLYVENQIWRDLAQTNEATANSLRSNLEQVLAHVSDDRHVSGCGGGVLADDAESSCGSCNEEKEVGVCDGWKMVEDKGVVGVKDKEVVVVVGGGGGGGGGGDNGNNSRMCKKCGERESSVLLLPCRHLCLCTMCGSTLLRTCPVCDSVMNASVHVNMS